MPYPVSGVVHEGDFTSVKNYPNAVFHYIVHIPDCCAGKSDCGLIVTHDNLNYEEAAAAEFLQKSGNAPACITVGIVSGDLAPTVENGAVRNLRMNTYDMSVGRYADFVVDELLPYLIGAYSLSISPSADMHLASGGSSGGISAWNLAWYRNDYFHRVYASSPTFSAIGGGESDPFLLRKFEPKPIRVFTDYSENEPDDYFGSSYLAAAGFERALRFAKYDFKCEYHPGEGHCSRRNRFDYAVFRQLYLWKDWDTTPITVPEYSARALEVLRKDEAWNICDAFPFASHKTVQTVHGVYTAVGGSITLTRSDGKTVVLTDEFESVSAIALSVDLWRLYIADKYSRCVYAATISEDGTFSGMYLLASVHVATDSRFAGVFDMCIDSDDRLYALTELGIQCIRAYGPVDVILHAPKYRGTEQIELGTDGKLYAKAGSTVYARLINGKTPADYSSCGTVKNNNYYN